MVKPTTNDTLLYMAAAIFAIAIGFRIFTDMKLDLFAGLMMGFMASWVFVQAERIDKEKKKQW